MKHEEYSPYYQLGIKIGQGLGWLGFWIMLGMFAIAGAIE